MLKPTLLPELNKAPRLICTCNTYTLAQTHRSQLHLYKLHLYACRVLCAHTYGSIFLYGDMRAAHSYRYPETHQVDQVAQCAFRSVLVVMMDSQSKDTF